ncbi:MAG: response regulator [Deltaproteobacteria bacterium]|nr:response regulator [Nannocystaceae bacterium]
MPAAASDRMFPPSASRSDRPREGTSSFRDIRVLVADDNPAIHEDFRRILAPTPASHAELDALSGALFGDDLPVNLRPCRFAIDYANQGAAALEHATTAVAAGRPFEVAFVDIRMPPGWNGVETAQRLRPVDPSLQIVLCTAYSDFRWDEVIAALGSSESVHLLRKPFGASDVRRMAEVLGTKAARLRR